MKMKLILGLSISIILYSNCTKETPLPEPIQPHEAITPPEFFFKGYFGSDSVVFYSNIDKITPNTRSAPCDDLFVFGSEMRQPLGNGQINGVDIFIRNYKYSPGNIVNFTYDSLFPSTNLDYFHYISHNNYFGKLDKAFIYFYSPNSSQSFSEFYNQTGLKFNIRNVSKHSTITATGDSTMKVTYDGSVNINLTSGTQLMTFNGVTLMAYPS